MYWGEGRVLHTWESCPAPERPKRERFMLRTCCFLINRPCFNSPWNKHHFLPCHIAYSVATQQINWDSKLPRSWTPGCLRLCQGTPGLRAQQTSQKQQSHPQPVKVAHCSLRRDCCPGKLRRMCTLTLVGLGSGLYSFWNLCHMRKQVALGGVIWERN